jgi:hypothetical protein
MVGSAAIPPTLMAEAWQEPQKALYEQVQLINQMCGAAPTTASQSSLDGVLALMPDHIQPSSSPFELISRWDAWMADGGQLSCSHPWAG